MSKDKAKKLKKQKKPMSPETRRTLGNTFKSLISNQACVDGGKEAPWWIAVIFLVLSICLPVIPITVNLSKAYGSQFIASYNYATDRGLAITSNAFKADGYDFKVQDDNLLHFYKDGSELTGEVNVNKNDIVNDASTSSTYYNFRMYITSYTGSVLTDYINGINNATYTKGTITATAKTDDNKDTLYTPSFIVLAPDTMVMVAHKNQSLDAAGSTSSGLNWINTAKGSLLDRVLKTKESSTTIPQKTADIFYNWRQVLDETYMYAKGIQMRNTSLLYLGVYAGLIFFLGLMIFLLTRGKNNPFHYLNFFVCQKISWWASFTPAVLGMIMGFIISGNIIGQMGFIVFASLRVMWLSMRQLRPLQ